MLSETGPGSAGLPSLCHPGTGSPGAGGMELALIREAGRLDAGQAAHLIQTQLELI